MSSALKPRRPRGRANAELLRGSSDAVEVLTGTVLRSAAEGRYVVHVEAPANGGSDEAGDGSENKPFATIKAAMAALPAVPQEPSDYALIKVGAGDFEYDYSYAGQLESVYVSGAFGSEETITVQAVTPVANNAVEVDIQATADIQTAVSRIGGAFLEASFGAEYRDYALYADLVVSKPAADTIRIAGNWWGAAQGDVLTLSTPATRIVPPAVGYPSVRIGRNTKLSYSNIVHDWTGYADFYTLSLKNIYYMFCCSVICPKIVLYDGSDSRALDSWLNCYFNCTDTFQVQKRIGHASSQVCCVLDATTLLFMEAAGNSFSRALLLDGSKVENRQFNGKASLSSTTYNGSHVRNCSAPFVVDGPYNHALFTGGLTVEGNCSRHVLVSNGGRVAYDEGSSFGATTDVPVQIEEGVVTGAASLSFTNSTTPGEEIKVGSNAAQAFSSLPATDFVGASATGSRAT